MLVFYFSLYYNVNGVSMARRHWKIPSSSLGKKNLNSPLAASPLVGNSFFSPWDSEGIFQYLLAIPPPFLHFLFFEKQEMVLCYTISVWVWNLTQTGDKLNFGPKNGNELFLIWKELGMVNFPIHGLAVIVKKSFPIRGFAAHGEIFFHYSC